MKRQIAMLLSLLLCGSILMCCGGESAAPEAGSAEEQSGEIRAIVEWAKEDTPEQVGGAAKNDKPDTVKINAMRIKNSRFEKGCYETVPDCAIIN